MSLRKKPVRVHNLKRPKIRADMRKENLYKLAKFKNPPQASRTFFQQKWTAKSLTRAYHGDHIREKLWTRMFDRRVNAVVPMDPAYLASHDGSDQAAGRGSGKQSRPEENDGKKKRGRELTPYMQMVYHPMERRLDIAIFRALFAASAKQARQLVLHGEVKVNGKPMIHPSYLLNPGDMFQVNPDRVMYCMGRRRTKASVIRNKFELKNMAKSPSATTPAEETPAPEHQDESPDEDALLDEEQTLAEAETAADIEPSDPAAANKKAIKSLMQRTRATLDDGKAKKTLSGKQKQDFRALLKNLRTTMSRAASATPSALDDLEAQFASLTSRVAGAAAAPPKTEEEKQAAQEPDADKSAAAAATAAAAENADPALQEAIEAARENPIDPSRPWATPWRPRAWMTPFAFIPRYLEVNQNICAAVYLRHPVCGPGFAEVPTPYAAETGQLAHAWYLRRR